MKVTKSVCLKACASFLLTTPLLAGVVKITKLQESNSQIKASIYSTPSIPALPPLTSNDHATPPIPPLPPPGLH